MEGERTPLLASRTVSNNPSWQTRFACVAVLISETFERIAFYGILGNLVMFLNEKPLDWTSYSALTGMYMFMGVTYMMSIFGGFIADNYLNRFRTIILFFFVYIIGYIFFPLLNPYPNGKEDNSSLPFICFGKEKGKSAQKHHEGNLDGVKTHPEDRTFHSPCSWAVYTGLFLIAIAVGSVKANIAPFGADQVQKQGLHIHRTFFNWFYFCINIGSFISLGGIAYVQQEQSFFWGYITCIICLTLSLCVFLIGGSVYVKKPATGSILINVGKVLLEACRMNSRRRNERAMVPSATIDSAQSNSTSVQPTCLDCAKVRYGGSFHDNMVEDVKSLGKIILVFFTLIPYWLVYFQMESTFVVQALHMKLGFRSNHSLAAAEKEIFRIPTAWLSLFDVIFLLMLLPLLDRVIYPRLDKAGYSPSIRLRIVIGMVLAVFSVLVAGFVENRRLDIYWQNNTQNIYWQVLGSRHNPTPYRAANMTVLYQIPQYAIIGLSEAFTSVAGLELAYMYAPKSMQSLVMGVFWCMQGLGCFLGIAIVNIFENVWFFNYDKGDINCRIICYNSTTCVFNNTIPDAKRRAEEGLTLKECHLDYYFFFLAGLQVVGTVLFIIIAWKFNIGGQSRRNKSNKIKSRGGSNHNTQPSSVRNDVEYERGVANSGMSNVQHRVNRNSEDYT